MINHHKWIIAGACTLLMYLMATTAGMCADICGRPREGRVAILREDRVVARFDVVLADKPDQWRQGLMHCSQLDLGTGMLFSYPDARRRVFWMKNTPLELAIVFIDADARITAIARGTPNSLARIHSPDGIAWVLEINWFDKRVLAVGDRVEPIFKDKE